jgi:hypothetical protein
MAITLRQIIARNGGTTGSFRDQTENCRNPDYFADRDIRSMAAWEGYRYLLRTDTESETKTRYSGWVCDTPAVNGRKTRVRYTDSRSRTRAVWSDGTTDAWGEWSAWQQTAAETEEAFDGTSCPYRTETESQSESKTEYGGWTCDTPAVNGRMTRHCYTYVRYRYRDIYSNGTAGAWGDWGGWTQTADTVEESYSGTSCPYQTGTGSRHVYGTWAYTLPTGTGAQGSRTRSHNLVTWPIYSNGTTGAESSTAQPNEIETVTSTRESRGSGYSCSGTYKQNYTTYRNVFKFSDTTQYSANYNVSSGLAAQVDGYCGYTATKYYICGVGGNTFAQCPEYYYFGIGLSASWPGMKLIAIPNQAKGCQALCFYKTTDTSTRVKIQSARLVNVSSPFYVSIQENFNTPRDYVTIGWDPYYNSNGPGSMAFGQSSLDYAYFTLEVTLVTGKKFNIEGFITRNDYQAGVTPWQTPPRYKNTQY